MYFVKILPAVGKFFTLRGLSPRERKNLAWGFEFFTFCRSRSGSGAPAQVTPPPPPLLRTWQAG